MPRMDYQKTQLYSIVSNDLKEFYVGSTIDFIGQRYHHKSCCNNINGKGYTHTLYQMIRANGGWSAWTMSRLEAYPCASKVEARQRERHWFELLSTGSKVEQESTKEKVRCPMCDKPLSRGYLTRHCKRIHNEECKRNGSAFRGKRIGLLLKLI